MSGSMYLSTGVRSRYCSHFVDAVIVRYKFNIFLLPGNDVQNAPFFVGKLGIKTLPCVILFRSDTFLFVFT